MTKKRYRKLFYALMQRINLDHIKWCGTPADEMGKLLKCAQRVEIKNAKVASYAEAWEMLKPLRQANGM